MIAVISAFDTVLPWLRIALFGVAVVLALVATLDWLVRTRRVNAFGPIARFCRRTVDPLIAPVERRVVRAGGLPTSAPWWALVFSVVGGIVLIEPLKFVRTQLAVATTMNSVGGFSMVLIGWTFGILRLALMVRVISSWVQVSPYSKWVRWSFVLTEPLLAPLRRVIPPLGMVDITPIAAFFLLGLLERFLLGL